jgi:hypothetical protein
MEQERHVLHQEHKDDLLKQVDNARKMRELVRLPAWTEILEPAIKGQRDVLLHTFKTRKFDNLSEVAAIQQGIDTLENLLSCIQEYIKTGEEAAETLKTQGKENA